jgi:hypothetical protein
MWQIETLPETEGRTVFVYADNQPFIRAATFPKAVPGQYLLQNFNEAANNSRAKIEVKWISGHSNVRGNERADKLAKEAATGRASSSANLPPILRRKLPISISSKNQAHMVRLKTEWADRWQESPRRQQFEAIDDSFPFNGYRKRQNKLPRAHASILLQVRSGHLPLNRYLYRIKKSDTKRCQACRLNPDDETPTEDIKHFLYDCDAYAQQRRFFIRAIGSANLPLKDIMSTTKGMKELAKYITRTGRFKKEV